MWIVVVCIVWPVWASFTRQWRHRVEQGLPQNQLLEIFWGFLIEISTRKLIGSTLTTHTNSSLAEEAEDEAEAEDEEEGEEDEENIFTNSSC